MLAYLFNHYLKNTILLLKHWGIIPTIHLVYKGLKSRILSYPTDITFETSSTCNLKCPMCILEKSFDLERDKRILSFEDFKNFIDEIKGYAVFLTLHYAGEPTVNKDLPRMIKYATKNNIITYMNTNGLLLDTPQKRRKLIESGIYKIHFSIDGTKSDTYEKLRKGGDFAKIKEIVGNFVKERGNRKIPFVGIQMIASKTTIGEKDDFKKLARELGADYAFLASLYVNQYKRIPSDDELSDLIFEQPSRYTEIKNGMASLKRKKSDKCELLNNVYILTSGKLIHCCYDYEAETSFGNVLQEGLLGVWRKPAYVKWRKEIAKPMMQEMCKSCTVGIPDQWKYVYRK